MKLKEKLAEEYSHTFDDSWPLWLYEKAFLAGFEKAREMAAKLFRESWNNPKYRERTYVNALNLIADDTLARGEEEVE